jgi:ribosomal protein L11 methyltransferase
LASLGSNDKDAGVTIDAIPDRDWNEVWAASLQPIRLGRRVRIRQSWHRCDAEFGGIELVIDPKRAFGTGHHATTQLLVEWLEEIIRGGERVLDVGTGSGILAMIGLRLGAASALAIDIDPVAVECAREYAQVNGFGAELELRVVSFETLDRERFDVVVANLDNSMLPVLSQYLPHLLAAHGMACLSGIQREDYKDIVGFLTQAGMQVNTCAVRDGWLRLEVQGAVLRSSAS